MLSATPVIHFALPFLFSGGAYVAGSAQGPESAPVVSALIENLEIKPERHAVQFEIRNIGTKPITAFSAALTRVGPDGNEIFCNGGGQDMIDWSDPMPGSNFVPGMLRKWIQPNQTLRSERYFMNCSDLVSSPDAARVKIELILFDDGFGEGRPAQLRGFLRNRQMLRDERLKWVARFSALRGADNLRAVSAQLYQDLMSAKHEAEADPDAAASNGLLRASQQRLQDLALHITQYAKTHEKLDERSREAWLITDLEQRTERLIRGAGSADMAIQQ